MSEKRVAPPDGGSGDLVLIQRHLENLSAGEILEELDARMEEMTDQSCDPELIRLYLDVLEEKEPLGLELDPEASLQRFLEERAGEESRSGPGTGPGGIPPAVPGGARRRGKQVHAAGGAGGPSGSVPSCRPPPFPPFSAHTDRCRRGRRPLWPGEHGRQFQAVGVRGPSDPGHASDRPPRGQPVRPDLCPAAPGGAGVHLPAGGAGCVWHRRAAGTQVAAGGV